jgi:hypothetical protein
MITWLRKEVKNSVSKYEITLDLDCEVLYIRRKVNLTQGKAIGSKLTAKTNITVFLPWYSTIAG